MTKIARVLSNPVVGKVEGVDDQTKLLLSDAMSFVVEGAEHMGGGWDGKSTLFNWTDAKFPAGFIPTVHSILTQQGYVIQNVKHPLPIPLGPLPTPDIPIVDNYARDDRYDYQFKSVSILEKHGSFIARVATGGGKSRLAQLCIKRIGRKTLFVTTRKVLLYQMGTALEKAGFKISYCGDSTWDTSGDVVLAMTHTLADRISDPKFVHLGMTQTEYNVALERHTRRKKQATELLESVEFIIGEEAHEVGGDAYFQIARACRKAHYRLALTATPLMRHGEANARLVASFGPIRLEVSEELLINRGILAKPIFKFRVIDPPPTLRRGTAWQKAEEVGIVMNHLRNKWICAEAIRGSKYGLPVMILCKRQKHGKILHEMLKNAGLKGTYIFGESNKLKRDEALELLRTGEYQYVIGSTILDVGVDVPAIGLLILGGGGKAEVAIRQRIGRGLRAKATGPNICLIVDFRDQQNKHLITHSRQRRAIVERTPGFNTGILKDKEDFDYVALGFTLKAEV